MSDFLSLDPKLCREHFGRQPFLVQHRLAEDERLSLASLTELARALPAKSVEYNAGNLPRSIDPALTPRNGLSVEETLRRIAECESWMVLKNVEQHPDYRELLDQCLAEVAQHSESVEPGMHDREAFVFVSSPGAVTPFHMDPEQNFLLQLRGRKTVHVFGPNDRAIVSESDVERFYDGGHRNLQWREEFEPRAQVYQLRPGLGLHMPVTAPHWVQNGTEVSISFSITFQTRQSARRGHFHRFNAGLRSWGLSPRPLGESRSGDAMKQLISRAKSRMERARARVARRRARAEAASGRGLRD